MMGRALCTERSKEAVVTTCEEFTIGLSWAACLTGTKMVNIFRVLPPLCKYMDEFCVPSMGKLVRGD